MLACLPSVVLSHRGHCHFVAARCCPQKRSPRRGATSHTLPRSPSAIRPASALPWSTRHSPRASPRTSSTTTTACFTGTAIAAAPPRTTSSPPRRPASASRHAGSCRTSRHRAPSAASACGGWHRAGGGIGGGRGGRRYWRPTNPEPYEPYRPRPHHAVPAPDGSTASSPGCTAEPSASGRGYPAARHATVTEGGRPWWGGSL